ncbi:hypothetical protein, variant 1 [Capsaspora owczarzaki ATCC 30864]|nr:hypothetical protein, variant 1 [Capsaspora owczarzaki ATCC 30864]
MLTLLGGATSSASDASASAAASSSSGHPSSAGAAATPANSMMLKMLAETTAAAPSGSGAGSQSSHDWCLKLLQAISHVMKSKSAAASLDAALTCLARVLESHLPAELRRDILSTHLARLVQQTTALASSAGLTTQVAAFGALSAMIRSLSSAMRPHVDKVEAVCSEALDSVHIDVVRAAASCLALCPTCGGSSSTYTQANPSDAWLVLANRALLTATKLLDVVRIDETAYLAPAVAGTPSSSASSSAKATKTNGGSKGNKSAKNGQSGALPMDESTTEPVVANNVAAGVLLPLFPYLDQQQQLAQPAAGTNTSISSLSQAALARDANVNSPTLSALIARRIQATFIVLAAMLQQPVSFVVSMPTHRILSLRHVLYLSEQQLLQEASKRPNKLAWIAWLPFLQHCTLDLLNVAITRCGAGILGDADDMLQTLVHVLEQHRRLQPVHRQRKAETLVAALTTLETLLSTLGGMLDATQLGSVGELLCEILCGGALFQAVSPATVPQSHLSGKKQKQQQQQKNIEESLGAASGALAVSRPLQFANTDICKLSLKALTRLLYTAGSRLPDAVRARIDATASRLVLETQLGAEAISLLSMQRPACSPMVEPTCRRALYRLLLACVVASASPVHSPVLMQVLRLLTTGTRDPALKVSTFCREAVAVCDNIIRPKFPTLRNGVAVANAIIAPYTPSVASTNDSTLTSILAPVRVDKPPMSTFGFGVPTTLPAPRPATVQAQPAPAPAPEPVAPASSVSAPAAPVDAAPVKSTASTPALVPAAVSKSESVTVSADATATPTRTKRGREEDRESVAEATASAPSKRIAAESLDEPSRPEVLFAACQPSIPPTVAPVVPPAAPIVNKHASSTSSVPAKSAVDDDDDDSEFMIVDEDPDSD